MPEIEVQEVAWALNFARTHSLDLPGDRGQIMYPTFSLIGHKCTGNSKFEIYPNKTIAVLSQTVIKAGDEINVSYVPPLEPTWKRRARLYRFLSIHYYAYR